MTAEHYITLILGLIASSAVVVGPILLYLIRMRHENRMDHAKVEAGQDAMTAQILALQAMVIDAVSTLKAHTAWEEQSKYASMEQIEELIQVVKDSAGE